MTASVRYIRQAITSRDAVPANNKWNRVPRYLKIKNISSWVSFEIVTHKKTINTEKEV